MLQLRLLRHTSSCNYSRACMTVASYGAYIAHRYLRMKFLIELDAPVGLVSSLEAPMPYAKSLEEVILPSKDRCLTQIHQVLEGCL